MKKRNLIAFAVPLFIASLSVFGTERMANADSGGRGGQSVVRGASPRGGTEMAARQGGDVGTRSIGRGGHVGRGSGYVGSGGGYVGRGGYSGRGGYVGRGGYPGYSGHRHGHSSFSGSIWIGPGWGFWDPFFYPYYPYPSYRYYTPPTVVVPQEPQEYIQQESEQEETRYWYYCRNPQGYYPYVERCPGGWMRVIPDTSPPDQEQEDKEN